MKKSEKEKEQAKEYIKAMGINFYSNNDKVFFLDEITCDEVSL